MKVNQSVLVSEASGLYNGLDYRIEMLKIRFSLIKKIFIQLPHFYRRFPAEFFGRYTRHLVWLLLLIIIATNLIFEWIIKDDIETKLRKQILADPTISSLHEKLGQYYLEINTKAAENEYKQAEEAYLNTLIVPSNVAGAASSPWQTWVNIKFQKELLEYDRNYWEIVAGRLPDYQYAKIKLAVLNFQLGDENKSSDYLLFVLRENPIDETARSLLSKLR